MANKVFFYRSKDNYLKGNNNLSLKENRVITPEEIVDSFMINNTLDFLHNNYTH